MLTSEGNGPSQHIEPDRSLSRIKEANLIVLERRCEANLLHREVLGN